jgi:ribosomal protein S12 methylthiotransferase accessory factor
MIYVAQEGLLASAVHAALKSSPLKEKTDWAGNRVLGRDSDILVACSDNSNMEFLLHWQRVAWAWATRLVCVHVDGGEAIIGPPVKPKEEGCVRCWFTRYYSGRDMARRFAQMSTLSWGTAKPVPELTRLGAAIIGEIAAGILTRMGSSNTDSRQEWEVYYWDLRALTGRQATVLPDPTCPECSHVPFDSAEAAQISLVSRPKPTSKADRLKSIEELHPNVEKTMAGRRTGIVREVSTAWRLTHGAVAISTVSLFDGGLESCGGFSDRYSSSRTISVLEAVERYSGVKPRARRPAIRGTVSSLRELAVDPELFGLYRDEGCEKHPKPIVPYHDQLELEFVWAYSFASNAPVLVPRQMGFYSHSESGELPFVVEGSNGCALGSCPEEALFHAILEVIERDAFLLAWYARKRLPQLDPMESTEPEIRTRCRRLRAAGYDLTVMDATVDFSIPAVWVLARSRKGNLPYAAAVGAAHIRPPQALRRALRELDNSINRLTLEMNDPEKVQRAHFLAENPAEVRSMTDHPLVYCSPRSSPELDFLTECPERTSVRAMEMSARELFSPDLTEELRRIIQRIQSTGSEVIAVNQTTPELSRFGLCTYKALITGAVPISWGQPLRIAGLPRLDAALRAACLSAPNPAPHPFD